MMQAATMLSSVALANADAVQVYIMMGQSNCVGEGNINGLQEGTLENAVKNKGLYQYLVDGDGNWTSRDDVRNVFIMGSGDTVPGRMQHNEWMTADTTAKPKSSNHNTVGLELGIGHALGEYLDEPVMVLKSCIGNRALGWDLLPPQGEQFEYVDSKNTTWIYAGYGESPARWEKGSTPKPIGWHAGLQYDGDTGNAKYILDNLDTYYPGATEYKISGFFWWQGDRDSRDDALASRYEHNLVYLIDSLRSQFNAPNAPFVTVTLGQSVIGDTNGAGKILDAMMAVDGDSGKYPKYAGNVKTVYSHPYSKGGSSGGHYNKNAETYMEIGQVTGDAMVELLKGSSDVVV